MVRLDLTGQTFGRWTVIEASPERKCKKIMWKCLCKCGASGLVATGALRLGSSKSCGCFDREVAAQRMTTHGHTLNGSRSIENYTYHHMVARCTNPLTRGYKDYGGRGIKVCEEWRGVDGFQKFFDHVGKRPSNKHSIDRIDVNKDYEPGNVRWATRTVQNRNKRVMSKNKTGVTGVWFNASSKKWLAKITVMRKQINLKTTHDFFEACCARKSAEIQYGEQS